MSATPPDPTFKQAKADAKAASAHAKALRPWYKKKRWIFGIGLAILVVAGSAGESSKSPSDGTSGNDRSASSGKSGKGDKKDGGDTTGRVGQAITNAGMTYKVTSARSAATIGDQSYGMGAKADGKFVIVDLQLTNRKDETKTFTSASAKLVTSDGKAYETTSEAMFAVDESLALKEVQPDLMTEGTLVFDVPPAKIAGSKLVIEDLWGKGEITVKLGL